MKIYNKINSALLIDIKKNNKGIYDLRGADLRGADLVDANLVDANLEDADLAGAYLTLANLTHANLRGADLVDANLRSADLTRANLTRANLAGVNLRYANLAGADLTNAVLEGADLENIITDINTVSLNYVQNKFDNIDITHTIITYFQNPSDDNMYFQAGCWFGDYKYWLDQINNFERDEDKKYKQNRLNALEYLIKMYNKKYN